MAGNGEIHVTLAKHVSIKNCMYYDKYIYNLSCYTRTVHVYVAFVYIYFCSLLHNEYCKLTSPLRH